MQLPFALLLLPVALAGPLNPDTKSPSPVPSEVASNGKRDGYKQYGGKAADFPGKAEWKSFEELWQQNLNWISQSSGAYAQDIKDSIQSVAQTSVIDERAILAVVMQESTGNAHVRTTISPDGSVRNPGLMQSHNGVEFNQNDPKGSILQMIKDGTLGTQSGDGLQQCFKRYESHGDGDKNIFNAFRCYNSGSVDLNNLDNALGATTRYVQDCANRLMGSPPQ
jgi:hypothetical protein